MSENDRHDAKPPWRERHPSLAEIVKEVVNERLDSLVPMNEEQLEILKRSESERVKRSAADELAREQRKLRAERESDFRKAAIAFLVAVTVLLQVVLAILKK